MAKVTVTARGLSSRLLGKSPLTISGSSGRLRTGCSSMDVALGGGVEVGKVLYVQGDETTGKSSLCEELALNFSSSGGLSVIYSCQGDHPLPGFSERVSAAGVNGSVLTVTVPDLSDVFDSMASLSSAVGGRVFYAVDDLSSFTRRMDRSRMSRDLSSHLASIRTAHPESTLVLVNQLRQVGDAVVGAVGYRVGMQMSDAAVHLSRGYPLSGPFGDEVGLYSDGTVLKIRGRVTLRASQPSFRLDVLFGRGVSDSLSRLEGDISAGVARRSGKYIVRDGTGDKPTVMLKRGDWVSYYDSDGTG